MGKTIKMNAETPAEGIMKTHEWGHSKMYKVTCGCGQPYHDHDVDIEADDTGVSVNIYATVKTDYWSEVITKSYDIENTAFQEAHWFFVDLINSIVRKLKLTWQLWTTGAITTETTIHMSTQQALNYAATLKSAVKDVEEFRNERCSKNG